jgi:hypothetical protein
MLNRLFARNVPEDRVQDAVDHGKDVEQRDALRERSAVILDRLERKRTELRRIELEERQAAKDAADRAALEAETAVEATAATEATAVAETGTASETGQGDTGAVEAMAPEVTATETGVAGNFAVETAETGQATGGYQPAPGGEETAAAFSSETTTAADGHFSESEPLRQHEAMTAETDYADERATGMTETPATNFGAVGAETPEADYPDVASDLPATACEAGSEETAGYQPDAVHPASAHSLAEEDPEVLEKIRRKAEEARARIAARLEQMQAGEGGDAGHDSERLDLGGDAPPMFGDSDDRPD